jgi:hypothetical protein
LHKANGWIHLFLGFCSLRCNVGLGRLWFIALIAILVPVKFWGFKCAVACSVPLSVAFQACLVEEGWAYHHAPGILDIVRCEDGLGLARILAHLARKQASALQQGWASGLPISVFGLVHEISLACILAHHATRHSLGHN